MLSQRNKCINLQCSPVSCQRTFHGSIGCLLLELLMSRRTHWCIIRNYFPHFGGRMSQIILQGGGLLLFCLGLTDMPPKNVAIFPKNPGVAAYTEINDRVTNCSGSWWARTKAQKCQAAMSHRALRGRPKTATEKTQCAPADDRKQCILDWLIPHFHHTVVVGVLWALGNLISLELLFTICSKCVYDRESLPE